MRFAAALSGFQIEQSVGSPPSSDNCLTKPLGSAAASKLHALNPRPVEFVKQASIAHAPQQVNNETAKPRARETEKQPNKLLETKNDQLLEPTTQDTTGFSDSALETMGAIHRPEDGGR
jgi:hypothetical protein